MRYERKYRVEDLGLAPARQAIRNHPASFRPLFPDRQVNNIYFDTPNLTAYHENVQGIAQRKKYRVRWYGTGPIIQPRLEVKIKDNQLGDKQSTAVQNFDWRSLSTLQREVQQHAGNFAVLRPTLVNAYQRAYYATPNGRFRLTLDWNLRYFSLYTGRQFTRFNLRDESVVLELKYEAIHEADVDRIRQFLPFRQTKSSKYVTGMNLLGQLY